MAPLDWGLGHATRCIPLIRYLLEMGCQVIVGAEGPQAALLREEFSSLTLLSLPGYRIRYAQHAHGFGLKMALQLPRIRRAIHQEQAWLRDVARQYYLDAVISDNRFGLHHPEIPSVIMTHQLLVPSPLGTMTERALQRANYHYIEKFDACWVVDFEGSDNLAGNLSHPQAMPGIPTRYLGALSRFTASRTEEPKWDLLAVVSGPEPQRSIFEKLLLEQIKASGLKALLVTGKPDEPHEEALSPRLTVVNHLSAARMNEAMLQSQMVVCRSGYTSVMDLVKLGKKAILVPTPGQTEQEYLASRLAEKQYFPAVSQKNFQLKAALKQASSFPFLLPEMNMNAFRKVLEELIS